MKDTKAKKSMVKTIVGAFLLLIGAVLVAVGGLVDLIPGGAATVNNVTVHYGVKNTIKIYVAGFTGDFTSHWSFVSFVVVILAVLFVVYEIVKAAKRHEGGLVFPSLCAALGFAFLPYLAALSYALVASQKATFTALVIVAISFALIVAGLILVLSRLFETDKLAHEVKEEKTQPANDYLSEDQIRVIVREEIEKYEEEKPQEVKEKCLSKEETEKIANAVVNKALAAHVEKKHADHDKEEPEEEEVVEEEVAVVEEENGEDDPFSKLKNKRRANFETRLRNSEFDLRHKYYDLRDHIKSYGLKNRISIPGDSFSAHRKRYAFLTINGKHIKAYFAANPDDYKDSSIPVERTTSKKYEDLPLQFKIRSDLSFRRACKLIDDMLQKEGYVREDKPIKNTQNPDEE